MALTQQELDEIVRLHGLWLAGDKDGKRADLTGADLCGADLYRANLCRAILTGANLTDANMGGANLLGANMARANMGGANLYRANLYRADLTGAKMARAILTCAKMARANMTGVNFYRANLSGTALPPSAALSIAQIRIVPEEGAFTAWKACRDGIVCKISVPADARRSNATGRKCRAEFVDVLEVFGADVGTSIYDPAVTYRAGERVTCDTWNDYWRRECTHGIHFFMTRAEAEAWAKR